VGGVGTPVHWARSAVRERDPDLFLTEVGDRLVGRLTPVQRDFTCTCGRGHVPDRITAQALSRPIVFAYGTGTRTWGSVHLRVEQSMSMLRFLGVRTDVSALTERRLLRSRVRGALVVLSKTALGAVDEPAVAGLRDRGNVVLVDGIDGRADEDRLADVDGFLCASSTEFAARSGPGTPTAYLVPHAIDARLRAVRRDDSGFAVAYVGRPYNGLHLADLDDVAVVATPRSARAWRDGLGWDRQLTAYSHHFTVRRQHPWDGHKPFMKGFVAAAVGACVIASAEDEEARALLGADYPYLAPTSGLDDARDCIALARATVDGPERIRAREAMTRLRELSCPISAGNRLAAALAAAAARADARS
jgi:hypothetical protein